MGICYLIIILPIIGIAILIFGITSFLGSFISETQANVNQAIVNYILKAKGNGLNNAEITSALQYNGWSKNEIKEAFDTLN